MTFINSQDVVLAMPLISVIVPVYKVEPYLHECVDSILNQTFKDFELILVDDGSPDNCPAICDEYAKNDSRVIVIHKENGGLSSARNTGLDYIFANSNSEYITFIDSDDYISELFLEKMFEAIIGNDMSVCYFARKNKSELILPEKRINTTVNKLDFLDLPAKYGFISIACNKMYKKSHFNDIRYPEGKIFEDEYVTHLIIYKCNSIAVIPDILYFYRLREDSITIKSNSDILKKSLLRSECFVEKSVFFLHHCNYNLFLRYFNIATNYIIHCYLSHYKEARNIYLEARNIYLKNIKICKHMTYKSKLFYRSPQLYCCLRRFGHILFFFRQL